MDALAHQTVKRVDTRADSALANAEGITASTTELRYDQNIVRLKEEVELSNATILSKIETHMSAHMYDQWIKKVETIPIREKYAHLLPFLQNWRRHIENSPEALRNFRKGSEMQSKNSCWVHRN